MPKYSVTGGPGGDAGVEIGGTRYEPGEVVDAPSKEVDWLVEAGYLSSSSKAPAASKAPAKTKGPG